MNNENTAVRPHFLTLDALRGVAALMVVAFHIFESHATSHLDQIINHGYLAVDFFFMLSGFVIAYAYDGRWQSLSLKEFFVRRLIRLQPMVIMGMVVGACLYYFQGSPLFPKVYEVPVCQMLLVMVVGFTVLPLPPSQDIRGWQEMHPLNGPAWTLFYEYIANILYALFLRRLGISVLSVLVLLFGAGHLFYTTTSAGGDIVGGWSITPEQLYVGFTRLLYPFCAGLLLCRIIKVRPVRNGLLICSLLLVTVLAMPRIGGTNGFWLNGLYESIVVIFIFPLIIYLGAGSLAGGRKGAALSRILGDISYPLYITHYPIVYTYMAYVSRNNYKLSDSWPAAIFVFVASLVLANASLKLYDEPVRKWLSKKSILNNLKA
ncbi:acyltransferase [Nostoc linckia z16]|nr:acyltransferase [Nostoc linckia z16]